MNFVILLSGHRRFGWIAEPWLVEPGKLNSLQLSMRCATEGLAAMTGLPEADAGRFVSLAASFSDSELTRRFAPKGTTEKVFLQQVQPEMIRDHIRPFIDGKVHEILTLAIKHEIAIFIRHEGSVLTPSMRVETLQAVAEPWFCFTKGEDGSSYVLEIWLNEKKLDLRKKDLHVITHTPCLVIAGNRLISFPEGFDGKKIVPFLTKDVIKIPSSAEKQYFATFIRKTLRTGEVRAEGFEVNDLSPPLVLELSFETDWKGHPVLLTWFRYGEKRILRGKSQQVFTELKTEGDHYAFYRIRRRPEQEENLYRRCLETGLIPSDSATFHIPGRTGIMQVDMYKTVEWLSLHEIEIRGIPAVVKQEGLNFCLGNVASAFHVTSGADWFDIEARVNFGEIEVPFTSLRNHILQGVREFQLPGGQIGVIPEEWFTRYHDLCAFGKFSGEKMQLGKFHFRLLQQMNAAFDTTSGQQLRMLEQDFKTENRHVSPVEAFHQHFKATLRPYQTEGVAWMKYMYEQNFGGCLADDMGLGKTVQALAWLLESRQEEQPASLVVMPASLIHNWKNEISRFAPSLRVLVHTGPQRTKEISFFNSVDLVLTTYGICRNDQNLFERYKFKYLILDESQVIKNPDALISQTVCSLRASHRLVLTGTPIENSLTDLWSQMQFLNPGMLGTLNDFRRIYVNGADPEKDEVKVSRLRKIVSPFILRRRKEEVEPDLPELSVESHYCEMTELQLQHYTREKSAIRNEILSGIESGSIPASSVQVLRALIRLRQSACHPRLVDPLYQGDSGKLTDVTARLETLREEGQKVLVFSSFVEHLKLVAGYFQANGYDYSMITGATIRREEEIRKFSGNANCNFFLISLKAGGTGLNLTSAGYVFMLDPWWNPAAELQAIHRAHRIGQDKKVIAYKFISKDSIEEKILTLQQRKQDLYDAFIPAGNPLKDLSREEAAGLFV